MSNRDQLFTPPPFENHNPLAQYQTAAKQPNFTRDEAQIRAIEYLDRLQTELMMFRRKRNRFLGRSLHSPQIPKELYFYGDVERGEGSLMNAFFGCLPYRRKRRMYFHVFMAKIHQRLKALKSGANPLRAAVAEIAKETRVLCSGEFHVSDIADAMILDRLLENLLSGGVVLMAAPDCAPSGLYPQGQDRSNFLPTIALIESNLTVLNVDGGKDYRLHTLRPAEIFFVPNNEESEQKLTALFKKMSGISKLSPGINIIHGREIPHKAQPEHVIWFDFRASYFGPRSQADYLYLAEHYKMALLSGLERLTPQEKAEARRLVWLIDVLYNFHVKLCATNAVGVGDIYVEDDFTEEFIRTASHIVEMQSEVYLEQPHLTLSK